MGIFRDGTGSEATPSNRPLYGTKVRELRAAVAMTQPELANRLNVKRGAVARWESGVREPQYQNYEALAAFADAQGLLLFGEFFRKQSAVKYLSGRRRRQGKREVKSAERRFVYVKRRALQGDKGAQHIIDLSDMDRAAYGKYLLESISKELARLRASRFSDVLEKFLEEAREVEKIQRARRKNG